MNLQDSLNHNISCWKEKVVIIDRDIDYMKGRKEALQDAIECLEIILDEQKNTAPATERSRSTGE